MLPPSPVALAGSVRRCGSQQPLAKTIYRFVPSLPAMRWLGGGLVGRDKSLASRNFALRTAALCLKTASEEHSGVLQDNTGFWGKPFCWRRQRDVEASFVRNVVQKKLLHPLPQVPNTTLKKAL